MTEPTPTHGARSRNPTAAANGPPPPLTPANLPQLAGPAWRALRSIPEQMERRERPLLPSSCRNARFVLFIAGILAYGAAFAGYLLVHFDPH